MSVVGLEKVSLDQLNHMHEGSGDGGLRPALRMIEDQ